MRKFIMAEKTRSNEQMLELSEDSMDPEHLDSQVQRAQEALLSLKRQQEQIEKQKRELEELSLARRSLNAVEPRWAISSLDRSLSSNAKPTTPRRNWKRFARPGKVLANTSN